MNGVTYHLNVDTLTRNEFESHEYPRITLTQRYLTWDPITTIYEDQENAMLNYKGNISAQMLQQGDRLWLSNLCVFQPVKTLQTSCLMTISQMFYSQMSTFLMSI